MNMIEMIFLAAFAYATAWALYLLTIPLLAILSRSRISTHQRKERAESPSIAVLIPGRNVAEVVGECIHALKSCEYPAEKLDIYVVADHCTDETAERARAAGVTALIRDDGPSGKTFTLAWTFDVLKQRDITPDLHVIVDATARVESGFLQAFASCWSEGAHIIANHTVVAASNRSWYARCLALMFVHRNLQNWCREKLKISALLTGCGMAFSREYIERFGWSLALPKTQGSHPTEDWRHAVRAVEEGYCIAFAENARIATPLRGSLAEATQQGARWERGRLINATTYAVKLFVRGLSQWRPIKIIAALDAMQPPVAILAVLALCIAVIGTISSEPGMTTVLTYLPVTLVGLYGLVIVIKGRQEGIGLATAFWGPLYVAWRLFAFLLSWSCLDRFNFDGRRRAIHARSSRPKGAQSDPIVPRG